MPGASRPQQNVYLVRAQEQIPETADPFIILNTKFLGDPLDGLYYFQEGDSQYRLLANANVSVGEAFGALSYDGASIPLTATTTPQIITGFDTVEPASGPKGVVPDPATDLITPESVGVFYIYFTVTALISSGTAYVVELYNAGLPTGVSAGTDASNQTTGVSLAGSGMRTNASLGNSVDLRVSTTAGTGAFDITSAEFGIHRISSFGEGTLSADQS